MLFFKTFSRIMHILHGQCPTNNSTQKWVKSGFLVPCNVWSAALSLNCSFVGKLEDFLKPEIVLFNLHLAWRLVLFLTKVCLFSISFWEVDTFSLEKKKKKKSIFMTNSIFNLSSYIGMWDFYLSFIRDRFVTASPCDEFSVFKKHISCHLLALSISCCG